MPGKVTLEITKGPITGQVFAFEEHNTFIFGRDIDCHARLSEDDRTASRHHFMLEVNPPDAFIRDLGSLNGTYVNGSKHGGRKPDETPEDAKDRRYPEVQIENGDKIEVGDTAFTVSITYPLYCIRCGEEISDASKSLSREDSTGNFTCSKCVEKEKQGPPPQPPPPVHCSQCGKDASKEAPPGLGRGYVCQSCRNKIVEDPLKILVGMFLKEHLRVGLAADEPRIPGYKVTGKLGEGGMGAVYLAVRDRDGERVAIKVMLSRVPVTMHAKKLFLREIEVTMTLSHPNIVTCFDKGSAGSGFYFVLEFCEGGSVDRVMAACGGGVPVSIAGPIMLQSLAGLAHAHENQFVHRDLKPANILLTAERGGMAKIGDFGLAKNFDLAGFSGMTQSRTAAGTWDYMPREQLLNYKYVKPVSDVWAMGATFYHILTGKPPRGDLPEGQDPAKIVLENPAIPIRRQNGFISKGLADVIDKSLAQRPGDRYQNAGEFLESLQKVL
ncbi:MAG: FHA domain-containing serine/threonine-protein kinase [Pseudomonadota bacterium]